MLVLTRKEGEQIVIGNNIMITVSRISQNRVTVGVDAPRDVQIVRRELDRHDEPSPAVIPTVRTQLSSERYAK